MLKSYSNLETKYRHKGWEYIIQFISIFYIIAIPDETRGTDYKHDPYVVAKLGFPL
jgi:hypothetical protein